MALADFNKGLSEMTVEAVNNGDSYSVLVGGKILCDLASGGCKRFASRLQAEVYGRQYTRGYTGGAYLSEDVDNFVIAAQ